MTEVYINSVIRMKLVRKWRRESEDARIIVHDDDDDNNNNNNNDCTDPNVKEGHERSNSGGTNFYCFF
jgi:hypothetical protein